MKAKVKELLIDRAAKYNDPVWFEEDPIAFPRKLALEGAPLQDVEIAAVFAALFAWGRRAMIVRDCNTLMEEMCWKPYDYVMTGDWRDEDASVHRTVKWSDVARICRSLREWYRWHDSLEGLSPDEMRVTVYGQKSDPKAANKKINMLRRWMVRRDGIVDLGLWQNTDPADLIVPLDVHVHAQARELGLTKRNPKDLRTALEITDAFREIWPEDPLMGDFALFGYGVDNA